MVVVLEMLSIIFLKKVFAVLVLAADGTMAAKRKPWH
jgi:hypothetical protein